MQPSGAERCGGEAAFTWLHGRERGGGGVGYGRVRASRLPRPAASRRAAKLDTTESRFRPTRQRIKLAPEQAIFLFVDNGTLPPSVAALQNVYDKYKDEDGFLYMTYSGENTFGDDFGDETCDR